MLPEWVSAVHFLHLLDVRRRPGRAKHTAHGGHGVKSNIAVVDQLKERGTDTLDPLETTKGGDGHPRGSKLGVQTDLEGLVVERVDECRKRACHPPWSWTELSASRCAIHAELMTS